MPYAQMLKYSRLIWNIRRQILKLEPEPKNQNIEPELNVKIKSAYVHTYFYRYDMDMRQRPLSMYVPELGSNSNLLSLDFGSIFYLFHLLLLLI